MKYSLYIGRWQPWHAGHRWLIDQQLSKGKNVCIAIRDMEKDEKNPFSSKEILENLNNELIFLGFNLNSIDILVTCGIRINYNYYK